MHCRNYKVLSTLQTLLNIILSFTKFITELLKCTFKYLKHCNNLTPFYDQIFATCHTTPLNTISSLVGENIFVALPLVECTLAQLSLYS